MKNIKIFSDQGIQFQSELWYLTLADNEIQPVLTSVRHLQGNLTEGVNKELGKIFTNILPQAAS